MLTDKALEEFTDWCRKNSCLHLIGKYRVVTAAITIWWLDTQNIIVQIFPTPSECVAYVKDYAGDMEEVRVFERGAKSRLRCTERAIETANKLYNDRFNQNEKNSQT